MLSLERWGCTTKLNSPELLDENFLICVLWFWMLYSSAQIGSCPWELHRFKVLASADKHPCHLARPLVTVAAVKGFGGRKTFHRAGRHPDSPPTGQVLIF